MIPAMPHISCPWRLEARTVGRVTHDPGVALAQGARCALSYGPEVGVIDKQLTRSKLALALAALVVWGCRCGTPTPPVKTSVPAQAPKAASGGGAAALLPADRHSVWRPGIPGGIPKVDTVHATIDAGIYGNGQSNASPAINAAIQKAGDAARTDKKAQVVFLPKGTYRLEESIVLNRSDVVLRGAGPKETKLLLHGKGPVIWTGWVDWPPSAVDIAGTVAADATTISVADPSPFRVGDIIQIDQLDDPAYVFVYDAWYAKRAPGWPNNGPVSAGGYRSVTSLHEVTGIAGTTVSFDPPTRIAYQAVLLLELRESFGQVFADDGTVLH